MNLPKREGMKANQDRIRLFRNPVLDRLTHVHPATPALIWVPVLSFFLWRALSVHGLSHATLASLVFAGFVTWTLSEYLLHRFVFHNV